MANEKFTPVSRVYPEVTPTQPIDLKMLSDVAEGFRNDMGGLTVPAGERKDVEVDDFCDQLQLLITEVCNQELLQKTENIRIELQQDSEVTVGRAED